MPRGSTALLDAIGRTADELGERLAAMPENGRPGQVIVAILTDGLENSSQTCTWNDIARVIKHQTEQYRWTFLFLGANQDAIATAAQLNIAAFNASPYAADAAGLRASSRSLSRKTRRLRRVSEGKASLQEVADAAAPLSQLTAKEEQRAALIFSDRSQNGRAPGSLRALISFGGILRRAGAR